MACWLMKSEPDVFGIDALKQKRVAPWDGVRNYQARNNLRAMAVGDRVLFHHSNANPSGIIGLATVVRTAYPDHTSWDPASNYFDPKSTPNHPRWDMVDVQYVRTFPRLLTLDELRTIPELADLVLLNNSRLSVQPVSDLHYEFIVRLADSGHSAAGGKAAKPGKKTR
jgi:predicted RNA-binding protein with PUA-like domain